MLSIVLLSSPMVGFSQSKPCDSEEHRQFDFWIGEWEVYNTGTETQVGTNVISRIENGCALRENWTSLTSTSTGTSFNYYDPATAKWNQLWLDNSGLILEISGSYSDNRMSLKSEPKGDPPFVDNITWTKNDDGTVRQEWRRKTGDKDWVVLFDGTYVKSND